MKTISITEVKSNLNHIIDTIDKRDEEYMITRDGKPVAVILSPDEYEGWLETRLIKQDADFYKDIKQSLKKFDAKANLYTLEELFK
jgi:prevent-host-death family protein